MTYRLRLAHLYPDVMNIYGDRGNIIALRYRCEARGIHLEVVDISLGEPFDPAVVSFDKETAQTEYDVIARGIADATVARLATEERLGEVSVIGNAAALTPPRRFRDVKAIGEAVDARYVVVAQVKRDESRVRLIAHLIRVGDEAHVWANSYDRSAFTLEAQAEIAEAIAAAVTGRLRDRR